MSTATLDHETNLSQESLEALSEKIAEIVTKHLNQHVADPDAQLRGLVPLLKEYTKKVQDFPSVLGAFPVPTAKIQSPLTSFLNTTKKLAQFVSQRLNRIEDEVLRMELELRLAEYEMVLAAYGVV